MYIYSLLWFPKKIISGIMGILMGKNSHVIWCCYVNIFKTELYISRLMDICTVVTDDFEMLNF